MTERELYLKAIDVIHRYGWVQRRFGNERCGFCIVGALLVAREGTAFSFDGAPLPIGMLAEVVGIPSHFNDHDCTTEDDVIAALEIAADLCA